MKLKSPASGKRTGLDFDTCDSNSSTNTKKRKGINHLKTLQDISNKWVKMGCYKTPDRALRALIGDQL